MELSDEKKQIETIKKIAKVVNGIGYLLSLYEFISGKISFGVILSLLSLLLSGVIYFLEHKAIFALKETVVEEETGGENRVADIYFAIISVICIGAWFILVLGAAKSTDQQTFTFLALPAIYSLLSVPVKFMTANTEKYGFILSITFLAYLLFLIGSFVFDDSVNGLYAVFLFIFILIVHIPTFAVWYVCMDFLGNPKKWTGSW